MTNEQFLAFSLPFKLVCQVTDRGFTKLSVLGAVYIDGQVSFFDTVESDHGFESVKPLLRPLSDFTKEIEHKGEKFVPIEKILQGSCFDTSKMIKEEIDSYADSILMPELMSLNDALLLIEWHFNLMDENEPFIDVNTLPENPYK